MNTSDDALISQQRTHSSGMSGATPHPRCRCRCRSSEPIDAATTAPRRPPTEGLSFKPEGLHAAKEKPGPDAIADRLHELAQDLQKTRQIVEALTELAFKDHLTGLTNRAFVERPETLQRLIELANDGRYGALIFVDLDRFKPINDIHGHLAGDHVLKVIARRLEERASIEDVVARVGGDEFALVVETPSLRDAEALAERIVSALAVPIRLPDGVAVSVTASVGVARYGADGRTLQALMACADQRMYAMKRISHSHRPLWSTATAHDHLM